MGTISAIFPPNISPICRLPSIIIPKTPTKSIQLQPNKHPPLNPRYTSVSPVSAERGSNGGRDDLEGDRRTPPINLRWRDLVEPEPKNLAAVALTGLLAWASAQVLWQIFVISVSILLAALKYSFIAALLLFILITLL